MKTKKEIDFKYNIREYWSILKKYKLLLFSAAAVILVIEALLIVDKFLFKIIKSLSFFEPHFLIKLVDFFITYFSKSINQFDFILSAITF